jgi:hypothetical protein
MQLNGLKRQVGFSVGVQNKIQNLGFPFGEHGKLRASLFASNGMIMYEIMISIAF